MYSVWITVDKKLVQNLKKHHKIVYDHKSKHLK